MTKEPDSEPKYSRTAYADGPRLLADIGATHARFALETAPGVLRSVRVLKCDDFAGIVPLLHSYLAARSRWPIRSAAT
jgi:glucokinase